MMEKISLIIPCKNEVESLGAVLEEVKDNKFVDEIIVVVDGEQDNSIPITRKFNCKLIIQQSKGYGSAIVEGFKNAKNNFGCIYNADHSFDPKYFDELIKLSKNNDFIFGSRYKGSGGSDDDDIVTFIGNKIFTFIGNLFFRLNISDILYTYIIGKTSSFKSLTLNYNDFRICVEIPIRAKRRKMKYTTIPSYERSRIGGKKKVNAIKDGLLISFAMIKLFLLKKK